MMDGQYDPGIVRFGEFAYGEVVGREGEMILIVEGTGPWNPGIYRLHKDTARPIRKREAQYLIARADGCCPHLYRWAFSDGILDDPIEPWNDLEGAAGNEERAKTR